MIFYHGPDVIVPRAGCGPRTLSLTTFLIDVWNSLHMCITPWSSKKAFWYHDLYRTGCQPFFYFLQIFSLFQVFINLSCSLNCIIFVRIFLTTVWSKCEFYFVMQPIFWWATMKQEVALTQAYIAQSAQTAQVYTAVFNHKCHLLATGNDSVFILTYSL